MTYVDALQTTLAAEHAAVGVLAYLGAQTSQSEQPVLHLALTEAYVAHRAARDLLGARVRDEGEEPVAAEPAYELPEVAGDPVLVARSALAVERSCARTYVFLVASSPAEDRRLAVDLLLQVALRELSLGGSPQRLPGR